MIREVDLVSYLPPFMAKYREPAAALEAENPEFLLAWSAADRILNNRFLSTADEYGISRFEKMLKIYPDKADDIETRRTRVLLRWNNRVPYTLRSLTAKLNEVLKGGHNFVLELKEYELVLTVYGLDDSQNAELEYVLSVMVPLNITTDIIYESPLAGSVFFGGIMQEADLSELRER